MKSIFRNWSDIRIFLMVVREGSTLAASRKLGLAQPTVARRIEVLENETGLILFERDTRGFKPTEDARKLFPLAEALEGAALKFATEADELKKFRPIRITASSSNFTSRVSEIFSEFAISNPKVSLEFLPSAKVFDLAAGEADIALRLTKTEADENLICRKLGTAHWALYGSKSYAEKYGLPVSPSDLTGHRFVTFERDDASADSHNWLQRHVSANQIVMSFSEYALVLAAIKAGHGLGIMNVKLAEAEGTMVPCFDPIKELSKQHLMLVAPEAYRRPEVKAFTKFFAPRYAAVFK